MNDALFIAGEPATFATKGEAPWKDLLYTGLAPHTPPTPWTTVALAFTVAQNLRNGQPFDLDNLCEPLFAVLAKAGWLDGGRRGLSRWYATKSAGAASGVTVRNAVPNPFDIGGADGPIYKGDLPRSGTDTNFAAWISHELPALARSNWQGGPIGIGLWFGDGKLNIGDIATGRVKNVVDCMWPLLGGRAGAPADWKVEALLVERGVKGLGEGELEVMVWEPGCDS